MTALLITTGFLIGFLIVVGPSLPLLPWTVEEAVMVLWWGFVGGVAVAVFIAFASVVQQ